MIIQTITAFVVAILAMASASLCAAENELPRAAELCPTISAGVLGDAYVVEMPNGTVASFYDTTITTADITEEIARLPEQERNKAQQCQAYILERILSRRLLAREANDWARQRGVSGTESQVTAAYLRARLPDVEVSEAEAREFYNEHAALFGDASFEELKEIIYSLIREEKIADAEAQLRNDAGKRHEVRVSASWLNEEIRKWTKNPVERARTSGKPALVVFSVAGCCDRMQPVVSILQNRYGDEAEFLFVNTREEPVLQEAYGVRAVPVLIFYDSTGKELFRRKGAVTVKGVLDRFAELGIVLGERRNDA